jgi:hypothetical protein
VNDQSRPRYGGRGPVGHPPLTGGSTAIRAYDGAGEETLALRVLLSGMMSKEEEKADKGEDQEIKDDAHGEW